MTMFSRKPAPLTVADLDMLDESYRAGAMLFDSEEHLRFIEDAITYFPLLIAAARDSIETKPSAGKRGGKGRR